METISQTKQIILSFLELQKISDITDANLRAKYLIEKNMFLEINKTYLNEIILSIKLIELPKYPIDLSVIFAEKISNKNTQDFSFKLQGSCYFIKTNEIINIAPKQDIDFFGKEPFMADIILFESIINFDLKFNARCFKIDSI
jgi:hypothetical protein